MAMRPRIELQVVVKDGSGRQKPLVASPEATRGTPQPLTDEMLLHMLSKSQVNIKGK